MRVLAGTKQDAALPHAEKATEIKALECHSTFVCTGITLLLTIVEAAFRYYHLSSQTQASLKPPIFIQPSTIATHGVPGPASVPLP